MLPVARLALDDTHSFQKLMAERKESISNYSEEIISACFFKWMVTSSEFFFLLEANCFGTALGVLALAALLM